MTPSETIQITQEILSDHQDEWEHRFVSYLKCTTQNIPEILKRRSKFHKWSNLSVYSTIGDAKDDKPKFDLRYQGQSVGSIVIENEKVMLCMSPTQYKNNKDSKYFEGFPDFEPNDEDKYKYKWRGPEAKEFRRYFSTYPEKKRHPEHRFENLLLKELSKKSSSNKSFIGIQPITLGKDIFFQLPTTLSASGKEIKYSSNGGGIDILARRDGHLVIFELKDEYKPSEGPEKVMSQAVAYATFITELCKTEAAEYFWKLCGLNDTEKRKEIYVSILMPDPGNGEIPYQGDVIEVPGSDMHLKLHYMFFDKETIAITRSSL